MCAAVVGATAAVCQLVTVEAGLRNNRGRTALIEAVLCGQMASVHVLALWSTEQLMQQGAAL